MPPKLRSETRRNTSWLAFPPEIRRIIIKHLLNQIITKAIGNEDGTFRRGQTLLCRGDQPHRLGIDKKDLLKITQTSYSFGLEDCKALCVRELASLVEDARLHNVAAYTWKETLSTPSHGYERGFDLRPLLIAQTMEWVVEILEKQAVSRSLIRHLVRVLLILICRRRGEMRVLTKESVVVRDAQMCRIGWMENRIGGV